MGMESAIFTQTFDGLGAPVANSAVNAMFDNVSSSTLYLDGNSGGAGCSFFQMANHCVTNFQSDADIALAYNVQPVFSVFFNTPQTSVSFAMVGGGRDMDTFTAFLNGVQVDQFTARLNSNYYNRPGPGNFFGFYDETLGFDQIQVQTRGSNLVAIDNVQMGESTPQSQTPSVPEPGGIALLAIGMAGIVFLLRMRGSRFA